MCEWLHGITTPSGSRWGIFALLLALSFFAIEGSGMLEMFFSSHPLLANLLFYGGVTFFIIAFVLGLLWLTRGSKDTGIAEVKKDIADIKKMLQEKGIGDEHNGTE